MEKLLLDKDLNHSHNTNTLGANFFTTFVVRELWPRNDVMKLHTNFLEMGDTEMA